MNYYFKEPADLFSDDAQDPMDAAKTRAEDDMRDAEPAKLIACTRCNAKTFSPLDPGAALCGKCWADAVIKGEI